MFTIGEFSKICQVSVKTLHHYDKIGLLHPFKVDSFTGYRYYDKQQIEQMLLIGRLKRYGFSLEEIGSFLSCSEKQLLFSKLRQQKEFLNRQKEELELIISELSSHLQNYERTGNIMEYQKGYKIEIVNTADMAVLAARQIMSVNDFGKYYGSLYERMAKDHFTPDGIRGAVYHDKEFNHESSDIELIIGIREKERADKIIHGQRCAMTVHKGPYSSLSDAYGALVAWIEENGYEWNGAPYDVYTKNQFDNLAPEEWETEVYFPIKNRA